MVFNKQLSPSFWVKIALINFLIVSILGLAMRLKMVLPMPWINQKFLLHSHSHFAFTGWVTHALMVFILVLFSQQAGIRNEEGLGRTGNRLVLANIVTAYGMLGTFIWQGYGFYSITFSTLSILISYLFTFYVWQILKKPSFTSMPTEVKKWFRFAVLLLIFSSIGTFVLSYLMATNNVDPRKQLGAVYFYLHFQYNGWFLFSCFGLLHHWMHKNGLVLKSGNLLFSVFAIAVIPTYMLSVLWWKMPVWVYILVIFASLAQIIVYAIWFVELYKKVKIFKTFANSLVRFILIIVGTAFFIKLLLQVLSLHPELSQIAYGYRPIIIGYLHLVLLVVISLFIWAFGLANHFIIDNPLVRFGVYIMITGILLNEIILMVQGLAGIFRLNIPYTTQSLAGVSVVIFIGIFIGLYGQKRKYFSNKL
jgi:hypothetical protein